MRTRRLIPYLLPPMLATLGASCDPGKPKPGVPDAPEINALVQQELEPCRNAVRTLANVVLEREQGKPKNDTVPFLIEPSPENIARGSIPICILVSSLEGKPRVLASARFDLDGTDVFEPSDFNQNTPTVAASTTVGPGEHSLTGRLASAPGTRVRVQVLETTGDVPAVPDDTASSTAVLQPGVSTTIAVGGAILTFPAGAVDSPLPVTAFEVFEPYSLSNRIELLPEGAQFEQPVAVDVPYDPLRLPPQVSEASLLASNAILVRHNSEWLPTSIDPATHHALAVIQHFSHIQVDSPVNRTYENVAGGRLLVDANHDLLIAKFPLHTPNIKAVLRSIPLGWDNDAPSFLLQQVVDHVAGLGGDTLGINASTWSPDSPLYLPDTGTNFGTGTGSLQWTVQLEPGNFDAEYLPTTPCTVPNGPQDACDQTPDCHNAGVLGDVLDDEYLIMIAGDDTTGISTDAFKKSQVLLATNAMSNDPSGHALLVGSSTSMIKDGCDCRTDVAADRWTILGYSDSELVLMVTRGETKVGGQALCAALSESQVHHAIRLDGGGSTTMVHQGETLNPLGVSPFAPARRVVNAIAVVYESEDDPTPPTILAPAYANAGEATAFTVTSGADPNGDLVKVECASSGVPTVKSALGPSGASFTATFTWPTAGSKTIYCTTFDELGHPSATVQKGIQVVRVDSVLTLSGGTTATVGQSTTFIVSGENMPLSTVAFIGNCQGPSGGGDTLGTKGDSTSKNFDCTPLLSGTMGGFIKTKAGGFELKKFNMDFVP